MPDALLNNVATILGFGFIGLSFLMLYLAYRAFKDIAEKEDPKPEVVRLARQFLYTSFAFLVAAGPLHLALLWGQANFQPTVNVKIALSTANWEITDGIVGVLSSEGVAPMPFTKLMKPDDTIFVSLDNVRQTIQTMRAQIRTTTEAALARVDSAPFGIPADPPPVLAPSLTPAATLSVDPDRAAQEAG